MGNQIKKMMNPDDMPVVGGFGQENPVTEEEIEMCNTMRPQIEAKLNDKFVMFEPVSFSSQIVAGTNYTIRIKVGEGQHISVTIFRPLPCNGEELELTDCVSLLL